MCELLKPLYEELKTEVLDTDYIQVDETTLPVIDKESHQAKKEYLWVVRSVMKKLVFFHYDEGSRSQSTVVSLLESYKGYLQSDGYNAYNVFDNKEQVCLVGCMAHIRRKYENALNENQALAQYALGEIQQLYRIEQMAEERKLSFKERAQLRTKLAEPIILSLEKWMEKTYSTVLPKSLMGQATAYSYSIWPRMKHYLKEGRLIIDNNLAYHNFSVIKTSRLEGLIFKHIRPGSLDNNKVISCISQRLRPNLRFQGAAISWADYLPLRQPFSQWLPAFAGQSLSDRLT